MIIKKVIIYKISIERKEINSDGKLIEKKRNRTKISEFNS